MIASAIILNIILLYRSIRRLRIKEVVKEGIAEGVASGLSRKISKEFSETIERAMKKATAFLITPKLFLYLDKEVVDSLHSQVASSEKTTGIERETVKETKNA